jgi:hypothetical protein
MTRIRTGQAQGSRGPRRLSRRSALAVIVGAATQTANIVDAIFASIAHPGIQRLVGFLDFGAPWVMVGFVLVLGGLLILVARMGDSFVRRLLLALQELCQRALTDGVNAGFFVGAWEAVMDVVDRTEPRSGVGQ